MGKHVRDFSIVLTDRLCEITGYYIDGEASASVDIPIGMGTGQPYK